MFTTRQPDLRLFFASSFFAVGAHLRVCVIARIDAVPTVLALAFGAIVNMQSIAALFIVGDASHLKPELMLMVGGIFGMIREVLIQRPMSLLFRGISNKATIDAEDVSLDVREVIETIVKFSA